MLGENRQIREAGRSCGRRASAIGVPEGGEGWFPGWMEWMVHAGRRKDATRVECLAGVFRVVLNPIDQDVLRRFKERALK